MTIQNSVLILPLYSLLLLHQLRTRALTPTPGPHFCVTSPCPPSYMITFFVKSVLIVYYYEYTYIPSSQAVYKVMFHFFYNFSFFLELLISLCFHLLYVCIVHFFQILQTPISKFSKHLNVSQFLNLPPSPFFSRNLSSTTSHPSAPVFQFIGFLSGPGPWECSLYTLSLSQFLAQGLTPTFFSICHLSVLSLLEVLWSV